MQSLVRIDDRLLGPRHSIELTRVGYADLLVNLANLDHALMLGPVFAPGFVSHRRVVRVVFLARG